MSLPDKPIDEGRTASYRMEELDADAELARLEAQVRLVTPLENDFLAATGLAADAWMLDVGCGPGFFAERAARDFVPKGRVTGVDVDPSLLSLGRARVEASGLAVEFLLGTAVRLPLPNNSVDLSYARFLLQHLDDPSVVVAEMVRVTRPGGVVALVDTDDGSLLVHPEPPGFAQLLAASLAAQRSRGGDRHVGRKLKAFLVAQGLDSPAVRLYPFTSEQVGAAQFLSVTTGFKASVLHSGWMDQSALDAVTDALARASTDPGFFGHALGYAAWARVPEP